MKRLRMEKRPGKSQFSPCPSPSLGSNGQKWQLSDCPRLYLRKDKGWQGVSHESDGSELEGHGHNVPQTFPWTSALDQSELVPGRATAKPCVHVISSGDAASQSRVRRTWKPRATQPSSEQHSYSVPSPTGRKRERDQARRRGRGLESFVSPPNLTSARCWAAAALLGT